MAGNLSQQLERQIGRKRLDLIRTVADKAFALGYSTFLAGGLVRDMMLREPHNDIDLVVEGDAIRLARSLGKSLGGKVTAHPQFLTATWQLSEPQSGITGLDLATSRSETYAAPAALPEVRAARIEQDLARRDFTVNAMAVRLDIDRWGELVDPRGGEDDVQGRAIRVLHAHSFVDDPTRMYRAVRYELRLGFAMTQDTLDLIPSGRGAVAALSAERIRHEFDLILDEPRCSEMLSRLHELDLMQAVHPALSWDPEAANRLAMHSNGSPPEVNDFSIRSLRWLLWLSVRSEEELNSLAVRLGFDGTLQRQLRIAGGLVRDSHSLGELKPSEVVAHLEGMPTIAVFAVALIRHGEKSGEVLEQYLHKWKEITPTTSGEDLKAAGLAPGPMYSRILARLRAAWIDGEVSSAEGERQLLQRLLSEQAGDGPSA